MNDYTVDTSVGFSVTLGRCSERETFTLDQLGFTQEELATQTIEETEKQIQKLYEDWQQNTLDGGWGIHE